jgi:hypothetical protein
METAALAQVSVWLDEMAPKQGAFAHSLEWASHLGLPLRAFASPLRNQGGGLGRRFKMEPATSNDMGPAGVGSAKNLQACAEACAQSGVDWSGLVWSRPGQATTEQFFRPTDLCVFSQTLPLPLRERLLRESLRCPQTAVLRCSQPWQPMSRVLVVDQHKHTGERFYENIIQLCRVLQTMPVILTVDRSCSEARRRQQFAEAACDRHRFAADFDSMVTYDVRRAVVSVAEWRRCSHVFMEKQIAWPQWRWLRGDEMGGLLGVTDSLTILSLPSLGVVVRGESRGASAV